MADNNQIMQEMREVIERWPSEMPLEDAARAHGEIEKELQAVAAKHGRKLQDFTGLEGGWRELLGKWSAQDKP